MTALLHLVILHHVSSTDSKPALLVIGCREPGYDDCVSFVFCIISQTFGADISHIAETDFI